MKSLTSLVAYGFLSSTVLCDGHGHSRTGGLLNHGNNNNDGGSSSGGGGGLSAGYGVPSGGYGAPSGGYGAPSGGGGGGYSSGGGAPSGGYGAPSGGGGGYGASGGGAPVYVYQGGSGGGTNDNGGGGAGGLLGTALAVALPIGAIALLGGLGLFTFGALFPNVVVGKRRKRDANFGNSTLQEQQLMMLQNYINFDELPQMNLHKDMVAKYLECGSDYDSPSLNGCLQKLSCLIYDQSVGLTQNEIEMANFVVDSVLENEFVTKDFKKRILKASKIGARQPGSCDVFKCHHHLLPQNL